MRPSHDHHRSRWVACPECGHEFTIRWNTKIRRFRAKMFSCSECGFVGRRGEFVDPLDADL